MAATAESKIEKALAYIAKHPGARSPDIAEAIGIGISSVSALLAPPVASGYLVACKVERPGKWSINEYRLSAAVAEDKMSWAEFRVAKRATTPAKAVPPPKTEARPISPATTTSTPVPVVSGPGHAKPTLIKIEPRVVFMVASTGQLRIEIPNHPPIICSRDETRDAGRLMISTEPVWA